MKDEERAAPGDTMDQDEARSPEEQKPRRKKRWWLRILLLLIVLLGALAVTAPMLVSTDWGTRRVLGMVNSRINGRMAIGDLELGWFGPCRVDGLLVRDAASRDVVTLDQLYWSKGLGNAIMGWEDFGDLKITRPAIVLYQQANGKSSLEEVFEGLMGPEDEEGEEEPTDQERLQALRGTLALEDGTIRIVSPAGEELLWDQVTVRCRAAGLAAATLSFSTKMKRTPSPTTAPATAAAEVLAGSADFQAKVARASAASPAVIEGGGTLTLLDPNGKPTGFSPVELKLGRMEYDQAASQLKVKAFALKARDALTLTVDEGVAVLSDDMKLDGKLRLQADLAECLALAQPVAGWRDVPAVAGKLLWNVSARMTGKTAHVEGKATIDALAIGVGKETVREDTVTLEHKATIDPQAKTVGIERVALASELLKAQLSGTVKNYQAGGDLDLKGQFNGSGERITALLRELAPEVAKQITTTGPMGGEFQVTGPVTKPEIKPSFRALGAGGSLGWTAVDALGLRIGKGSLAPSLKDAVLSIPVSEVPVSGGTLRLGGTVDLTGQTPAFRLPGKTQLVEKVQINPRVGEQLLSYVNPLFAKAAALEGSLSLSVSDVDVPLGEEVKKRGHAKGRLDISDMKLKPTGLLATLVELGGLATGTTYDVTFSEMDFLLRDGRISYEDLALTFSESFDLKFRGSVGFDDTVELWASVPVKPALLRKFGVKGPVEEYAKLLGQQKARVEIPIVGSRLAPKLGNVDLRPLVRKAAESLLKGRGLPLPKGLLDKLGPATQPSKDKTGGSLFDALRKSLTDKPKGSGGPD